MYYEEDATMSIMADINMMIPWYLMSSYSYYVENDPIFSDQYYDNLAKNLLSNWDNVDHFHKSLISADDLTAGTYLGEYPSRVKGALKSLRKCIT